MQFGSALVAMVGLSFVLFHQACCSETTALDLSVEVMLPWNNKKTNFDVTQNSGTWPDTGSVSGSGSGSGGSLGSGNIDDISHESYDAGVISKFVNYAKKVRQRRNAGTWNNMASGEEFNSGDDSSDSTQSPNELSERKKEIVGCESSPCQHQGACVTTSYAYICECVNGYTGKNCEEVAESLVKHIMTDVKNHATTAIAVFFALLLILLILLGCFCNRVRIERNWILERHHSDLEAGSRHSIPKTGWLNVTWMIIKRGCCCGEQNQAEQKTSVHHLWTIQRHSGGQSGHQRSRHDTDASYFSPKALQSIQSSKEDFLRCSNRASQIVSAHATRSGSAKSQGSGATNGRDSANSHTSNDFSKRRHSVRSAGSAHKSRRGSHEPESTRKTRMSARLDPRTSQSGGPDNELPSMHTYSSVHSNQYPQAGKATRSNAMLNDRPSRTSPNIRETHPMPTKTHGKAASQTKVVTSHTSNSSAEGRAFTSEDFQSILSSRKMSYESDWSHHS